MQWRTGVFGFQPGGPSPADFWYLGDFGDVHVGNTLMRTLVEVEFGYSVEIDNLGGNNVLPPPGVMCGFDLNGEGPVDVLGNVLETNSRDWVWTGSIGANYSRQVGALSSNIDTINYRFTWVGGHTGAAESVKGQRLIRSESWGMGFNWRFMSDANPTTGLVQPAGFVMRGTAVVRTLWRF